MMMLLPGSRPQDVTSSPTPVCKKISDATQSSVKTEDEEESEYTYETGKHGRKICYALYPSVCIGFFQLPISVYTNYHQNSHFWSSVGMYSAFFSHNTLPPIHLA